MAIIFAIIAAVAIITCGILGYMLIVERKTTEKIWIDYEDASRTVDREQTLRKATRAQLGKTRLDLGEKRRESIRADLFLTELIKQNPTLEFKVDRSTARELFLR